MAKIVMKFGGTSVADIARIRNVALLVKREVDAGHEVAVVVSAMAGETNKLVGWTRELSPLHDAREYDAVVAAGEQVTAGLLAVALSAIGVSARSWMGWQVPIRTSAMHGSARITDIEPDLMNERLKQGQVAVVAGLSGNRTRQPHIDAGTRRFGHQCCRPRCGAQSGPLRHLHRR